MTTPVTTTQDVIWLPLKNYEGLYVISNTGIVKAVMRTILNTKGRLHTVKEKPIKVFIDRAGYPTVKLTKGPVYGTQYLHRMIGLTFLPNPENKCCINHKNGNKLDYSLENLEWSTHRENYLHAIRTGLSKPIGTYNTRVINMCDGTEFQSIKKAAAFYDIEYHKFKQMLRGLKPNYTCLKMAA